MFSRRNLTIVIGTFILSLAAVIGAMPAGSESGTTERSSKTRLVQVDSVEWAASTREVRFPGVTRSVRRAEMAFTIPARLAARPVDVGDRVRAGEVLARLDANEYELAARSADAMLAELDARLQQARRDEARVAQLARAKAATAEELEKTEAGTAAIAAAREAAAARVEDTRRLLRETSLVAPFDGTITAVKLEPGEWASPGSTVVELSGSAAIEVRIEVPESMRGKIAPGTLVAVDLPMSGRSIEGVVASISDAAGESGALFPLFVRLESGEGIVAGMAAEVVLPLGSSNELTVPLAAVLDSGSNRPSVFRIEDGVATRVTIRPGHVVGDRLTVSAEGLSEGDRVAVVGHTALVEGDKVEVR